MKNIVEIGIKKTDLRSLIIKRGLNRNYTHPNIELPDKKLKGIKKPRSKESKKYEELLNIQFIIELNNYKGNRHSLNLPTRGQRSRTNARTAKKRKIVQTLTDI